MLVLSVTTQVVLPKLLQWYLADFAKPGSSGAQAALGAAAALTGGPLAWGWIHSPYLVYIRPQFSYVA